MLGTALVRSGFYVLVALIVAAARIGLTRAKGGGSSSASGGRSSSTGTSGSTGGARATASVSALSGAASGKAGGTPVRAYQPGVVYTSGAAGVVPAARNIRYTGGAAAGGAAGRAGGTTASLRPYPYYVGLIGLSYEDPFYGPGFHNATAGKSAKAPDCQVDSPVDAQTLLTNGTQQYLNQTLFNQTIQAHQGNHVALQAIQAIRADLVKAQVNISVPEQFINKTALDLACNSATRGLAPSPLLASVALGLATWHLLGAPSAASSRWWGQPGPRKSRA